LRLKSFKGASKVFDERAMFFFMLQIYINILITLYFSADLFLIGTFRPLIASEPALKFYCKRLCLVTVLSGTRSEGLTSLNSQALRV
jgi:hypothetical protein